MEEGVKPDEEQPKAEQQLRLDETGADTAYSNFFLISTGVEEFFLNFGMRTSDPMLVKLTDRVILSPKNFKRLAIAMSQSLKLYEEADKLIALCTKRLTEAEQKIETLIKSREGALALDKDGKPQMEKLNQ